MYKCIQDQVTHAYIYVYHLEFNLRIKNGASQINNLKTGNFAAVRGLYAHITQYSLADCIIGLEKHVLNKGYDYLTSIHQYFFVRSQVLLVDKLLNNSAF